MCQWGSALENGAPLHFIQTEGPLAERAGGPVPASPSPPSLETQLLRVSSTSLSWRGEAASSLLHCPMQGKQTLPVLTCPWRKRGDFKAKIDLELHTADFCKNKWPLLVSFPSTEVVWLKGQECGFLQHVLTKCLLSASNSARH